MAPKAHEYLNGTWGDRLTKYDVGSIQYNEAGYPTMYRGHVLSWEKGNLQYFDNTDFIYNDSGIRIAKGSTDYFVKGNQILAEKRGSTVIHYYYDENGVAGFEYAGQQYYYRKNLQGDIIGIYDSCGNLLGEYKYDAWGNILSQGGSNILTINPFRYRGYYYDEETGLYYLNSRYYDPETGRFISPDDVGVLDETFTQPNGLNLYAYCYNNPVMMTDPDGAFALTWWQKLLIGLAFITLGAIATALSGGSFAAAFVCGLSVAMKSAVTGAIVRIKEPGPVWSVGMASNIIRAVKERKRSDPGAVCQKPVRSRAGCPRRRGRRRTPRSRRVRSSARPRVRGASARPTRSPPKRASDAR